MRQRDETDQQIIGRVLHHKHRTDYALLVERYGARLFAFVATIVTRREDAEELAEDCFVKAFERLEQYDATQSSFYTWLRCIAYRLCLNYVRRQSVVWLDMDDQTLQVVPDEAAEHVMDADDDRRIRLLTEAIHRLPPTERLLVQQFYFEQQPLNAIAEITDTDAGTLATRLHRIRKKLYQYIIIKEHGK